MIKDIGCEWVILGHSERRNIFKETDEVSDINQSSSPPLLALQDQFPFSCTFTTEMFRAHSNKRF